LGNVTATIDQNAKVLNRYTYKPFGELLSKEGTAPDPKFLWVGSRGYRQTGNKHSDVYVRARHYDMRTGRWTSRDPLWPRESAYGYVGANPTSSVDPSGFQLLIGGSGLMLGGSAGGIGVSEGGTLIRPWAPALPRVSPELCRPRPMPISFPVPRDQEQSRAKRECDEIHDTYKPICQRARECKKTDHCSVLFEKLYNGHHCKKWRKIYLDKCVPQHVTPRKGGQMPDHRGQLREVIEAINNCIDIINKRPDCWKTPPVILPPQPGQIEERPGKSPIAH
jgi:RHS repeat-associated protein